MSSKTFQTFVWILGFSVRESFFNFAFGPVGAICESRFNWNLGFSFNSISTSTGLDDIAMSCDNSINLIFFLIFTLSLEFNSEERKSTIFGISKFSEDQNFGAS